MVAASMNEARASATATIEHWRDAHRDIYAAERTFCSPTRSAAACISI